MGAHDYIGNFVQNGTVEPIQMTEEAKAGFLPQAVKGVTFNGQVYAVPYAVENVVLFRNTSLAPEAPKTIDEMVEIGKRLRAEGKVKEILALPVGQNGDAYHSYPIYTSGGGYLFGVDDKGNYDPADLGVAKPAAVRRSRSSPNLARRARRPKTFDHCG
jgi:arabinogalactan oligomer/maltooligosaccharide transport system substrate-binding protein